MENQPENQREVQSSSTTATASRAGRVIGRWLLVMPAAVAASIAARLCAEFLLWLSSNRLGGGETWLFYLVSNLAPSAVGGFVFVVAGARVAPKGRKFVAITLVAIHLVVVTLYLAGTWFGVLTFEGEHLWMANLSMATHLCAAVAAMVAFILDEDWIKV